ncbi:MAG: BrnT family toxin [Gammaproteobacteria bacterium]|nr:MAG: BrnT family toxin [Gammaproteobacteria bacterium]
MIDLAKVIEFDWDAGNARKNERHGVSAGEAEEVFFSAPLLLLDDQRHSQEEPRYHALGVTAAGRRLHVSFTLRRDGTAIRVISARDMSKKERAVYEQASKNDS